MASRRIVFMALLIFMALVVGACNLSGAPSEEQIALTATAQMTLGTGQPSRTPLSTSGVPTTVPVMRPTNLPTFTFPTAIVQVPTRISTAVIPTSAPPPVIPTSSTPLSIVILSPVSGNVVAGGVQILGSASHPQFLQYQVEFGPDPNPGNLWFPVTAANTTPVVNGLLGIWNTNSVQDSRYQLRLRVYLRDGTLLTTVINNITVQNRVSTPVPSPTPSIPRPIAAFTQDRASGDVPLTVQFTNQSSGTINSVAWNFGDGNSSGEVNPRHTFGAPGLYTVTLTVNGPGGSSNVSRQINVSSPTAPVAGFTMDQASGLAPLTVQFTDQSTGNVTSYQWFFSDGSTSQLRSPSHTFTTPGTYNVFLTVSGPGGASSVTRQITVTSLIPPTLTSSLTFTPTFTPTPTPTNTTTVVPPTATPTATATPTNTETVIPPVDTLTPSATFTATPTPTDTSTTVPPTPTPTDTATVPPTNTTTVVPPTPTPTDTSTSVPPTATPTDTSTSVPPTPTFTDTATSIPPTATPTDTSTSVPPTPTFTETATQIPPTATSTDTATAVPPTPTPTDTATAVPPTPTPTNTEFPAPQANFTAAASPSDPFTFQFTNTSSGQIATYAWDFGDGTTSNEASPTHTYNAPGTYTVTLMVTDTIGRSSVFSGAATIAEPVNAGFSASATNLDVQFLDQSTGPVVSYAWDFGDGTTSTEQNPLHTYATAGSYTVTLKVTSNDGSTDSETQSVSATIPVQASFSAQPNNLDVQFTDQSTGPVASWTWDFGDGGTSNEQSPLHAYDAAGTYTVTLTVSDAGGGSNSTSQQVTVNAPVQANFSAQPNNLDVQFTDQSTGPVASWAWDFGDGGTSNEQSPLHSYAAEGSYTVTLTVSDAVGGSNSTSQQVSVSAPVQAGFSAQPDGLNVQFTDQSTGTITQWAWDFGDGTTSNEQSPLHTYAAAGSYTVTLVVTGSNGSTDDQSQMVDVTAPVEANFTAQPTDLSVQFTDASTGGPVSWAWDFGDGTTSNEQSPLHTYAADGTYTVKLTVTDANGRSDDFASDVTVAAAAQPTTSAQPGLVDSTPIQPDLSALQSFLRPIYANGINTTGTRATVFAVAGDSTFVENGVLAPFASPSDYNLDSNTNLQAIIDWFNSTDLGGFTSYNRSSLAVDENWTAQDLLDPSQADPSCGGTAPLTCELQQTLPVIMFVSVGSNDAVAGTDPATFQTTLLQVINTIVANGTIPVLMTVPDDGSSPNTTAINDAIITTAQTNNVPVLNVARLLNELPSENLEASPTGAGDLSNSAVSEYGINAVNFRLLRVLLDARNIIFPDA